MVNFSPIKKYFKNRFLEHGACPSGSDWNSLDAQIVRFEQLTKVIEPLTPFSIIDYGCGYGAMVDFLENKWNSFLYQGFDIVEEIILFDKKHFSKNKNLHFTSDENFLKKTDYVIESGIFNVKQSVENDIWKKYVLQTLIKMNDLATHGMAFNLLTKYSDPEFMRPDLYYADPCFYFDFCIKNFSKNVALLHDYKLYDFTIIVKK